MLRTKIPKSDIPILCVCIGIFVLPYVLRNRLIGSYALLNLFSYGGLLYALNQNVIQQPKLKRNNFLKCLFALIYVCLCSIILFYIKGTGWSFTRRFLLLFVYVFPAAFIYMNLEEDKIKIRYCIIWVKCLRTVCTMMCIAKVMDLLLNNAIQKMFATFYKSNTLLYLIRSGRFVSYYGHALNTAWFSLTLLVWTTVVHNFSDNKSKYYVYDIIIAIIGIAIAGSKSGLILALLLLLLCNIGIRKIKYMISILLGFSVLYVTGVFDTVIGRILEGLRVGDLSTSRNTALERLLKSGTISFDWLKGHVIDYDGTSMIAALEYPFLRWAFTCGIVFTIIIYIAYFLIPIIKALKSFNVVVIICVLVFMAFVNGNNGISSYSDDLLFYSINIGLLLQLLSINKKRNRNNGKD